MQDQRPAEACQIRARQESSFGELMRRVLESNDFYRRKYEEAGVPSSRPVGLSDLTALPFTTLAELARDQREHPPYGTNLTFPLVKYSRCRRAAGPPALRWLETEEDRQRRLECWREVFEAARLSPDDRVLVVGEDQGSEATEVGGDAGALFETTRETTPEGVLSVMQETAPDVLIVPYRDARELARQARRQDSGPGAPARRLILHSIPVGTSFGLQERRALSPLGEGYHPVASDSGLGAWAYGCSQSPALHLHEAHVIAEVIDPDGSEPASRQSPRGELVLTPLGRVGNPVIRLRTGILVSLDVKVCPCGRSTRRLKRWEVRGSARRSDKAHRRAG